MSPTVAVLGPGAVGGALAVHLSRAGQRVVCVARRETAEPVVAHGLTLELGDQITTASPEVVELLSESVGLLLVTVKAPSLERALRRISPGAVAGAVVVPLLNGLEHVATIRERLGAPTAAGSVSRFEAYRFGPTHIVQLTQTLVVTAASNEIEEEALMQALAPLAAAGVDVRPGASERGVLWEKTARLGPLAAMTSLTQLSIGELRTDPEWRATLAAAIEESCAVAGADGISLSPAEQWTILDAMSPDLTTSAARDVAAGKPSELDAIVGGIVRAGRRHGVPTPILDSLLVQLEGA